MHHDGFYAHLAASALNTQRNFTAIGNQDFFKHALPPRRNNLCGYRTLGDLAELRCQLADGHRVLRLELS
jgi:hypothetical protein